MGKMNVIVISRLSNTWVLCFQAVLVPLFDRYFHPGLKVSPVQLKIY